jgi:glyoxylate/hydroxypyruvate reductase
VAGHIAFVSTDEPDEFGAWVAVLSAALPADVIVPIATTRDLDDTDVASIEYAIVSAPAAGALSRLPRLRFVQSLWAGVDGLLADATLPAVPIARMVDPAMTTSMVVTVVAHVTSLHLGLHRFRTRQAERQWAYLDQSPSSSTTVAVIGLGALGSACAAALVGLGFRVVGWSRTPRDVLGVAGFHGALEDVVAQADIIVNLLPLTAATRGIFSRAVLEAAPHGASIVNVGRGPSIDHEALISLLDSGHFDHAVLDVFDIEPLPADDRRWTHPQITVTPHIAAVTSKHSATAIAVANIARFRRTGLADNIVDRIREY